MIQIIHVYHGLRHKIALYRQIHTTNIFTTTYIFTVKSNTVNLVCALSDYIL